MKFNEIKKKVSLKLVGLDGNAFSLMGAFSRQAKREDWSKEEIDCVIAECTSGDYSNLLNALGDVCEDPQGDEDDDYYESDKEMYDDPDYEPELNPGGGPYRIEDCR